jgi:hypothetical protein
MLIGAIVMGIFMGLVIRSSVGTPGILGLLLVSAASVGFGQQTLP